jgi:hypothetical protein
MGGKFVLALGQRPTAGITDSMQVEPSCTSGSGQRSGGKCLYLQRNRSKRIHLGSHFLTGSFY